MRIYDNTGQEKAANGPTAGTFTITGTGFASAPTGTARWSRIGNLVILYLPAITGTSSGTGFTMTGLPAAITPARDQRVPNVQVTDNSILGAGSLKIGTDGVITIGFGLTALLGLFTALGTKEFAGCTVPYLLD